MKPYFFLNKVKSLELHKNNCSKYGIESFSFVTRNTKDVDGIVLKKKFLGLKYTLQLLQSTVTKSEAIFGHAAGNSTIPASNKHPSLYTNLWLGIDHRWLAYHIVDHLFSLNKVLCDGKPKPKQ